MRRKAAALLPAVAMLILSCHRISSPDKEVIRLRDGAQITFAHMLKELQDVDFVVVGEVHDQMASHRAQLRIIKGLWNSGQTLAVGLEMFWAESQPQLDHWLNGDMDDDDFIRLYYRDWGLPWPLYRPILSFLKERKIPMVGLNVRPALTEKVAAGGVESLTEQERRELPPGLSCDISGEYENYVRQVFRMHGGEEKKSFRNFCETQVLWDKVMAWHLIRYKDRHPDRQIVVLAGLAHALKRGIPARLAELSKGATTCIIVPEAPTIPLDSITAGLADYFIPE